MIVMVKRKKWGSMPYITHEAGHMKRKIRRRELTEAERERLHHCFPERQMGDKGRPTQNLGQMLNGILWIARGCGFSAPSE